VEEAGNAGLEEEAAQKLNQKGQFNCLMKQALSG
jgi:hypothetical protein